MITNAQVRFEFHMWSQQMARAIAQKDWAEILRLQDQYESFVTAQGI